MNERKEKSAVGNGVPTTEMENNTTESITDNSEKIKPFENINRILGKLTEVLQLTDKCCEVVRIEKIGDVAVIYFLDGRAECINIGGDSGIAVIYDIVKKLMWR